MFLEAGSHLGFFQGWGDLIINLFNRGWGSNCMDNRFTLYSYFFVMDFN